MSDNTIKQMTTPPDAVDIETYKWVYDKAQGYWTPLCPEYPNLYGLTCEDIQKFIDDFVSVGTYEIRIKKGNDYKNIPLRSEKEKRDYIESYLHHVKCLDRIELFDICDRLGTKLKDKLRENLYEKSNAYITSPRGGYEVLSIFSYANDIPKECIPMDFRPFEGKLYHLYLYNMDISQLQYMENFTRNIIIIDDIIASGQQFTLSINNLEMYYRYNNITYEPVIFYVTVATRKNPTWLTRQVRAYEEGSKLIDKEALSLTMDVFGNRTVSYYTTIGIETFNALYINNLLDEDHLITLRFPWGSPDGKSDQLLRSLYKGRHHEPEIHRRRYTEDVSMTPLQRHNPQNRIIRHPIRDRLRKFTI